MATANQLVTSGGPYINALAPSIQQIAASGNPFLANAAAQILYAYSKNWGERNVYNTQPDLPTNLVDTRLRDAYESTVIKNMLFKLNSIPQSTNNAWVEFIKVINLLYQITDPITFFLIDGAIKASMAVPWLAGSTTMCMPYSGIFYLDRIGVNRRPVTDGVGSGFEIIEKERGSAGTPAETVVNFRSVNYLDDDNCPKLAWLPVGAIENRYFLLNTIADTIMVWYNAGTGVQPIDATATKFIEVDISAAKTMDDLKVATDTAITLDGDYTALNNICCPDCGCLTSSQYVAASNGQVAHAIDGGNGFWDVVTEMKATDGTTIGTFVSDEDWMNGWNQQLVPYQDSIGAPVNYILDLAGVASDNGAGCCTSIPWQTAHIPSTWTPSGCWRLCSTNAFVQAPALPVLNQLPINKGGVLSNAAAGINRADASIIS